jgi:hypothetical protein
MRGMPNRKCHNAVVDSIVEIAQQWNTFLLVVAHFELSNRMNEPETGGDTSIYFAGPVGLSLTHV